MKASKWGIGTGIRVIQSIIRMFDYNYYYHQFVVLLFYRLEEAVYGVFRIKLMANNKILHGNLMLLLFFLLLVPIFIHSNKMKAAKRIIMVQWTQPKKTIND